MAARGCGIDPYVAAEAGESARSVLNALRNAATAKSHADRADYISEAQAELGNISAAKHPKLINAIQAKLLALQGRGGDTSVAHVGAGAVVEQMVELVTKARLAVVVVVAVEHPELLEHLILSRAKPCATARQQAAAGQTVGGAPVIIRAEGGRA